MSIKGERITRRENYEADGSVLPNRFVKAGSLSTTGIATVIEASAGDDFLIGVSQADPDGNGTDAIADGETLEVVEGYVHAYISEAVTYGDELMVTGSDGALALAENATATDTVLAAKALQTTTVAGIFLVDTSIMNQVRSV